MLGVDGGNTKTVALVATADGAIVGAGRDGCADIHGASSPDAAVDAIAGAVRAALVAAGAGAGDLGAAVFSLAGADWPEDLALLRSALPAALPALAAFDVMNDAIGAVRAGTDDGVGVSVVSGTGGAIGARNAAGERWHLGFWPDGMGGRAIGRNALRAIYRAGLALGPATSLSERAFALFGVGSSLELLHAFTARDRGLGEDDLPRLAAVVLDEAAAGDPIARAIATTEGRHLGAAARVAAGRVGFGDAPFPLVIAGGVLRHRASSLIVDAIAAEVPLGQIVRPAWEPAIGALLLALDAVAATPDLARLRTTLPPSELFAT